MKGENDIRWIQRFANYRKALASLREFIEWGELNKMEEQGLIKAFEYTYELAWNTLKDFLENQGDQDIAGSRDTIRRAFSRGIIKDGEAWMRMLTTRNLTSHTYNESVARDLAIAIKDSYFAHFCELEETLMRRQEEVLKF